MLTIIYSSAGGGKSYLTIKKALQAAKGKSLLIVTYEMSSYNILKRVDACLDYLHIEAPKKITVQEKDLSSVITPMLFEKVLHELFTQYDVIALDGYFLNNLHSSLNLSAEDTHQILKKSLSDVLRHNPSKQIIVNINTNRPNQYLYGSNVNEENIEKLKQDFFSSELNIKNEEHILIYRKGFEAFHVFEYNTKKHDIFDNSDFTFNINK